MWWPESGEQGRMPSASAMFLQHGPPLDFAGSAPARSGHEKRQAANALPATFLSFAREGKGHRLVHCLFTVEAVADLGRPAETAPGARCERPVVWHVANVHSLEGGPLCLADEDVRFDGLVGEFLSDAGRAKVLAASLRMHGSLVTVQDPVKKGCEGTGSFPPLFFLFPGCEGWAVGM